MSKDMERRADQKKYLVHKFELWVNYKTRRIYLVVDIPLHEADTVILKLMREYKDDELAEYVTMPYSDWVTITQEKQQLKPFIPRIT